MRLLLKLATQLTYLVIKQNSNQKRSNPRMDKKLAFPPSTNAYHAMEETGGVLKVSLNKIEANSDLNLPEGFHNCLRVKDNCVGIPPNKSLIIFLTLILLRKNWERVQVWAFCHPWDC